MPKLKSAYFCKNCGAESPKWFGKCNACGEWNTCVEEIVKKESGNKISLGNIGIEPSKPVRLEEVETTAELRVDTASGELNRVLGGGLVPGSLVLIGGEPGIGKSTLVLQVALNMKGKKVLYISGEESVKQLKLRAERLAPPSPAEGGDVSRVSLTNISEEIKNEQRLTSPPSGGLGGAECYVVSETVLEQIFVHIKNVQPDVVIIDSIQTVSSEMFESSAGSISQIRECAAAILKYAKETATPVFLIGHITKDGNIAGPKVLEHIVDTVLQFEGDQHHLYRILRSIKNRFGSTSELGIFEMRQDGLREVSNPSEMLLSQHHEAMSGIAISAAIEGIRPFLIEVQSLVSTAAYGTPQRSSTGFDLRRLNMLLAVLEKRAGFKIAQKDVFLNIAGGLKVNDPAIDLAVITAVLSSSMDIALDKNTCMAGEVGLSGEIRPVNRIEQRIAEAEKLGFRRILIPRFKGLNIKTSIEILPVGKVEEAFRLLFK